MSRIEINKKNLSGLIVITCWLKRKIEKHTDAHHSIVKTVMTTFKHFKDAELCHENIDRNQNNDIIVHI